MRRVIGERERERHTEKQILFDISIDRYLYIVRYIYIYGYIDRQKDKVGKKERGRKRLRKRRASEGLEGVVRGLF